MLKTCAYGRGLRTAVLALWAAGVAGCGTMGEPPEAAREDPGRAPGGVILLLSDDQPAYSEVAREVRKRLKIPVEVHNLHGTATPTPALRARIQKSDKRALVAVGDSAARAARGLTGKQVVFCQVFNYEELGLVTPWMRGVAVLPSLDAQLQSWKRLSPDLKHVGLITGRQLTGLVAEARAAAQANGITLTHVEVGSDREYLYAYQRLAPKVQGMWLIPDHRVLSTKLLYDVLSYSVKKGKPVHVFHRDLLQLGGLISAESEYADIAERVVTRLNGLRRDGSIAGDPVLPLTRARIAVNTVLAKRFKLQVPAGLEGVAHAR